jgi:hypothetical protein
MRFSNFGRKFYLAFWLCCMTAMASSISSAEKNFPVMTVEKLIAAWGMPDEIGSTEYDKPRPLFVTKWLIYHKEKVKFMLIADAPLGSPPPYSLWRLIGAMDPRNDALLDAKEVLKRFGNRRRE